MKIGVICAYRIDFTIWVEENEKPGEEYHAIYSENDLRNMTFSRIELTRDWHKLKNAEKIRIEALAKCR